MPVVGAQAADYVGVVDVVGGEVGEGAGDGDTPTRPAWVAGRVVPGGW